MRIVEELIDTECWNGLVRYDSGGIVGGKFEEKELELVILSVYLWFKNIDHIFLPVWNISRGFQEVNYVWSFRTDFIGCLKFLY